jgi:hypothetical protein
MVLCLLKGRNILVIGVIKTKMKLAGHVGRVTEDNIVQKVKRRKPMSKRPIGRPKMRWEDDGLEDARSRKYRNRKNLAQIRDCWEEVG